MSAIDIKDTVDTSTPALLIEVPAKVSLLAYRSSEELSPLLYIETFFSTIIERSPFKNAYLVQLVIRGTDDIDLHS